MAIFFTSPKPVLPTIHAALKESLAAVPRTGIDLEKEAAFKTVQVAQALSPKFNAWRFAGAAAIAAALILGAIWTGIHNLPDISKGLMNSFSGFSGLVLGLLGGEAQKSASTS